MVLTGFLSEFAQQPFVKMKVVSPDLISRIFSSDGTYLYWIKNLVSEPRTNVIKIPEKLEVIKREK